MSSKYSQRTAANERLQTDDVGIFGSTLSNEYLLVAEAFGLSRRNMLELCGRSVEMIFSGEEEKGRLRTIVAQHKTLMGKE